jgi:hypothetical protein
MEPKSRAVELERLGAERWEQQQRAQAAEMQERQRQHEGRTAGLCTRTSCQVCSRTRS